MSKIDEAVAWAVSIAYDNAHGYDQTNRWGPDYDCSSLVISSWEQSGVPVKSRGGATYTGNMKRAFLSCGFAEVTDGSRQKGDVLLNEASHTAMMINGYQLVQAGSNEFGGVTGGVTGDQTGNEIRVMGYYDFPWDCVLRYTQDSASTTVSTQVNTQDNTYTVKSGDTLWGIAVVNGTTVYSLKTINGLKSDMIYPGQVLKIKEDADDAQGVVRGNSRDDVSDGSDGSGDSGELQREVTVKAGDTLWSLAEKYLGAGWKYAELADYNGISSADINTIYAGQVLKLPKK